MHRLRPFNKRLPPYNSFPPHSSANLLTRYVNLINDNNFFLKKKIVWYVLPDYRIVLARGAVKLEEGKG